MRARVGVNDPAAGCTPSAARTSPPHQLEFSVSSFDRPIKCHRRLMLLHAAAIAPSRVPMNTPEMEAAPLGEIVHAQLLRPGRARTAYSMPLYSMGASVARRPRGYRAIWSVGCYRVGRRPRCLSGWSAAPAMCGEGRPRLRAVPSGWKERSRGHAPDGKQAFLSQVP